MEAAIYTTKVILLKFFNLFNTNVNATEPIDEIQWAPSQPDTTAHASVVQLPSTQQGVPYSRTSELRTELIGLILNFQSVCFSISQVDNEHGFLVYIQPWERYFSLVNINGCQIEAQLFNG